LIGEFETLRGRSAKLRISRLLININNPPVDLRFFIERMSIIST
jgi:hypothetical protein